MTHFICDYAIYPNPQPMGVAAVDYTTTLSRHSGSMCHIMQMYILPEKSYESATCTEL